MYCVKCGKWGSACSCPSRNFTPPPPQSISFGGSQIGTIDHRGMINSINNQFNGRQVDAFGNLNINGTMMHIGPGNNLLPK